MTWIPFFRHEPITDIRWKNTALQRPSKNSSTGIGDVTLGPEAPWKMGTQGQEEE